MKATPAKPSQRRASWSAWSASKSWSRGWPIFGHGQDSGPQFHRPDHDHLHQSLWPPPSPSEKDGPEQFHLVLLDNGRSEILASEEYRETLRCIRCGACLNACPVYRKIGGHAYGSVYPGPIGALITPLFSGLDKYKDLPQASSLCGACGEACPVKINIPRHLVRLRQDIVNQKLNGRLERDFYRLWAWGLKSPLLYRWIGVLQAFDLRRRADSMAGSPNSPKSPPAGPKSATCPPPPNAPSTKSGASPMTPLIKKVSRALGRQEPLAGSHSASAQ